MKEIYEKTHEYISTNWQNAVVDKTDESDEWFLPYPFVPPCLHGAFKALFYWDTYYTNLGMIANGKTQLAKNNVDDLLYELSKKGFVPNAWSVPGTTYCSQPPYLYRMVADIYRATQDEAWLKDAYFLLKREYTFWMTERTSETGLNRHYHLPLTDEQLLGYYEYVASERLHLKNDDTPREEKIRVAHHYVAVAESGLDWSPRFRRECADVNPVDLNANLYGLEKHLAAWAKKFEPEKEAEYQAAAKHRKDLMDKYCLGDDGLYHDYDFVKKSRGNFACTGQFMPFVTGLQGKEEKDRAAAKRLYEKLLYGHGVTCCEPYDAEGAVYQWAYPNSWAPDNYLAYTALKNCGLLEEAAEVAKRYMDNVAQTFEKTGKLWEKYDGVVGGAATQTEHDMTEMLGWTGGVFSHFYAETK